MKPPSHSLYARLIEDQRAQPHDWILTLGYEFLLPPRTHNTHNRHTIIFSRESVVDCSYYASYDHFRRKNTHNNPRDPHNNVNWLAAIAQPNEGRQARDWPKRGWRR